ncbi:hypothetical protein ABZ805_06290 [Saccharopolyspora sp. NPDC047091]|uniref:hypothetical protein n=1 Tax=Saccharopolyspora sp. NPDC047091 TaxID=3155924 RepID=UPI00340A9608
MPDSLRTAGGSRGWRLLARALVVAGAAAAGSSVGWFAGNAGADALVDPPAAEGAHESTSDGTVDLAPVRDAIAPEHRATPNSDEGAPSAAHRVSTAVHHIAAPLARAADIPDADSGTGTAPRPGSSEVDGPDPGRFALDELAPHHLVGRVAEARPVSTALDGAGSLLRPVRGALTPGPGADRPVPPLAELTRPITDGLGALTAPLRDAIAPGTPAPPAPLPSPGPAPVEQPLPNPLAPAAEAPRAPAVSAAEAADAPAPVTAHDAGDASFRAPAEPGHREPWSPDGTVPVPPATGGATGHTSDGGAGNGGLGMTWPLPADSADRAALSSPGRSDSVLNGTFAPSPGTTPD